MYFIFRGTDFFFRKISSLINEIFPKEEQVSIYKNINLITKFHKTLIHDCYTVKNPDNIGNFDLI